MESVLLRGTDLEVSRLGLGGCPLGGHGWGQTHRNELMAAVDAALDAGVNFLDTADVYGLGQSEMLLGEVLRGRRDRVVIATKCGVRVENGRTFYDNSPQWIRQACEGSLRRLNTDRIDLYQLHYRDGTPLESVLETFEILREQGKIRYFGLSNLKETDLPELAAHRGKFAAVQNAYSLADREGEATFREICGALDATALTWGSLGQGILTGKYGPDSRFGADDRRSRETYRNFRGEKFRKNLQIVEAMKPIAENHGVSVAAVAVRFILDRLPGSVALCGIKRKEQLLTDALGWHLSGEEMDALDRVSRQEEQK